MFSSGILALQKAQELISISSSLDAAPRARALHSGLGAGVWNKDAEVSSSPKTY